MVCPASQGEGLAGGGYASSSGWTGMFCPCVLFGGNVENMRDDVPWIKPCVCHAICIEGGIALAALIIILFHGVALNVLAFIELVIVFCWSMCGVYTGLFRRYLLKKYFLKGEEDPDHSLLHYCFHWCALCQEHREMKARVAQDMFKPITIVKPPVFQDMNWN